MSIEERTLARCNNEWCTSYTDPDQITDDIDRSYYDGLVANAYDQRKIDTDIACKAYCKIDCPHLVEYCWQDVTEMPCKGFRQFKKELDKQ